MNSVNLLLPDVIDTRLETIPKWIRITSEEAFLFQFSCLFHGQFLSESIRKRQDMGWFALQGAGHFYFVVAVSVDPN